jgi:hypothetical protein
LRSYAAIRSTGQAVYEVRLQKSEAPAATRDVLVIKKGPGDGD